ncbi:MAG: cytochrome c biogenesis protein CcsA [Spirochaetes bacterium]|nr:cytochrome c biogenesis protein CcsA [Spirochaetota bacterium]
MMNPLSLCLWAAAVCYAAAAILTFLKRAGAGYASITAGVIFNGAFLIQRGWIAGVFVPNGIVEGVFLTPFFMAAILLLLGLRNRRDLSFMSAAVLPALFGAFALLYPRGIIPPTPNKLTVWSVLFFMTESAGHACLYTGGWLALAGIIRRDDSERYHSLLLWGFVLFSVAQVTGALWAFLGWGSVFRWGSRHLQSAVIWCYFAAYLHLRFLPGWDRIKRLAFAAAGMIVIAGCTFGSSLAEMKFPRIGG